MSVNETSTSPTEGSSFHSDSAWDEELWCKVSSVATPSTPLTTQKEPKTDREPVTQRFSRSKSFWWSARVVAILGWSYAAIKTFVGDFDIAIANQLGQWAETAINYRFVLLLLMLLVVFLSVKRPVQPILFIAFFPLIVLLWYIPKAVAKMRSWIAFLAATNATAIVFRRFTRNVILVLIATLSTFVIFFVTSPPLLYLSTAALAVILCYLYTRYLISAFQGSEFLNVQLSLLQRVYRSKPFKDFTSVDKHLRGADIEVFDRTQRELFLQKVSFGLIAHKALYFWAYQLDRYRRSSAPAIFEALSYAWLVFTTVSLMSLVNLGLDRASASSFAGGEIGVLRMTRYTVASLYGGEINGVMPTSQLAEVAAIVSMLGFGTIVLTIIVGILRARWNKTQEEHYDQVLNAIELEANAFHTRFEEEFDVSPDVAEQRLNELSFALTGWIAAISREIPSDFLDAST